MIKGQTPHFDFISQTSIDAIMNLSIENKKPIGNGIFNLFKHETSKRAINQKRKKEKKLQKLLFQFYQKMIFNQMTLQYSPKNNPKSNYYSKIIWKIL